MADNHTVIAEQGAVRGTIRGTEDVVVFGYVEGRVELDGTLFVEPSGIVKADVDARHVVIAGVVVGDVSARDCVELLPSGRVVGNLSTPRLVMAAGGAVRGQVSMGAAGDPKPEVAAPAAPKRPVTASRPEVSSRAPRATDEPVWRRPTAQMVAVPAASAPAAPARAPQQEAAPVRLSQLEPPPQRYAPPDPTPAPRPQPPAPAAAAAAPAAPAPQEPERPSAPAERPIPRPARRSFEDLDTLFPVIPESSMDGWAVSVPSSGPHDDGSGSREG